MSHSFSGWIAVAGLAGLLVAGAPVRAAVDDALGFERTPPRLAFIDGEVSFFRPGAQDWAPASVNTPLAALITELRALTDTVNEQQQRLSRLEKRFGLPNSTPTGESRRRDELTRDVSWPLDLNRDRDRETVDKAVSFHDV